MKRLASIVILSTAALLISPLLHAQRGMAGRGGGGGSFHGGGGFRSAPSGGFRSAVLPDLAQPPVVDSDQGPASAHLAHGLAAFHLLLQLGEHSHRGVLYPATVSL